MEIALVAIAVVAIVIFIVGGMDNNRPVDEWSDEKLARMHEKLVRLASIKIKAGNYKSDKNDLLLDGVKKEIIARQMAHDIGGAVAEGVKERSQRNIKEWAEAVENYSLKNNTTKEKAHEILSTMMPQLIKKYHAMGHSQSDATDFALNEIKNV
jgi:hypothetical protein